MTRQATKPAAAAAVEDPPAATEPIDAFGGVVLATVFGKHVQRILSPYLRHAEGCDPAACSCGLAAAVAELERTEVMALRYGA